MRNNLAVIDADSFCYICSKDSLAASLGIANRLMKDIMIETNSSHYYMFVSPSGKYFRHRINEEYKGNRPESPLLFLKEVKEHLKKKYNALEYKGLEADDLMGFVNTNTKWEGGDIITCAIDKDVIKTLPGKWYNYYKREAGETSLEDAEKFTYIQALAGDSGDNIKGLFKIGPKKADKMLDTYKHDFGIEKVFRGYLDHHKGKIGPAVYDFQKNFRQTYILRSETDFINEVGYVPELPSPFKY